ncbi:hypothetical protein [Streptomyces blattellae]|uniref:hypothetical protein n=1 Tax=Streptomyces blattellae TaxID=2569855 RepID=UPI0012B88CD7|nr:hypothetical protein [Streptomyces blattellae]
METEPDWERVESRFLRCGGCQLGQVFTAALREPADARSTCPSCAALTPHPAAADLARCLTCGLLYRLGPVPSKVSVRRGLARVAFDGWTVTLTRLWCPFPFWRHRRVTLDRVVHAEYQASSSDHSSRRRVVFRLHMRNGDGRALSLVGLRDQDSRRDQRFEAMCTMIDAAVAGRVRLLLQHSIGLGPWSEREWRTIDELLSEMSDSIEMPTSSYYDPWLPREMLEEGLRGMRGERDARIAGRPRPVPGLPSLDEEPTALRSRPFPRKYAEIWLTLADRLSVTSDVTTTDQWRGMTVVLLGYGLHWSTVIPRRGG